MNEIVNCIHCKKSINRILESVLSEDEKYYFCFDCWKELNDKFDMIYKDFIHQTSNDFKSKCRYCGVIS
jgi:DNA-directed RNA polymerase subunit RPC12/RpoP